LGPESSRVTTPFLNSGAILISILDTDEGICKECILARLPDEELCEGCKVYWIEHIHFTEKFHIYVSTVPSVSGIIAGITAFWMNHKFEWLSESPPMSQVRTCNPSSPRPQLV
jgi:hypothetical protein